MSKRLVFSLLVATALAGCGGGAGTHLPPMQTGNTSQPSQPATPAPSAAVLATAVLGGADGFVDAAQHTVYVFDDDLAAPGHSTCNAACAQTWPHVSPPAGATLSAPWSTIKRDDGSVQLAYAGRPLYTIVSDAKPGDVTGVYGPWHIARPQATGGTAPTPTPSPAPVGPTY